MLAGCNSQSECRITPCSVGRMQQPIRIHNYHMQCWQDATANQNAELFHAVLEGCNSQSEYIIIPCSVFQDATANQNTELSRAVLAGCNSQSEYRIILRSVGRLQQPIRIQNYPLQCCLSAIVQCSAACCMPATWAALTCLILSAPLSDSYRVALP